MALLLPPLLSATVDLPFGLLFLRPTALVRRAGRFAVLLALDLVIVAGAAVVALALPNLSAHVAIAVALWAVAAVRAGRMRHARRLDRAYRLDALFLRQRLPEAVLRRCLVSRQHVYGACVALRALGVARATPAPKRRRRLAALYAPTPPVLVEGVVLLAAFAAWIGLASPGTVDLNVGIGAATLVFAADVALGAAALRLRDDHEAYLDDLASVADREDAPEPLAAHPIAGSFSPPEPLTTRPDAAEAPLVAPTVV